MMSGSMCSGHKAAAGLVWIGAINWGLIGFFGFNLVNAIVGSIPTLERVIYALVGLAAVYLLFGKSCAMCKKA